MKKLINRPEDLVKEELQGMALAHADLAVCGEMAALLAGRS